MPKRLLYSCLKIRLIEKGNSALRYCQNLGIKAGVLLDQSKIGAGVAFADGNLYVSDKNRIFRFSNILKKLGEKNYS